MISMFFSSSIRCYTLTLLSVALLITNLSAQELYSPDKVAVKKEINLKLPVFKQTKKVSIDIIDGMAIVEGDIVLGKESDFGQRAIVVDGASKRWPNSTIPYVIDAGHPKKTDIEWAIAHINAETNICMVPRTTQADYVQFINGSGCSSWVGRQGGRQNITIGSCSKGSIAHEICHAAGLWHEQSREDRDNFVTVNLANVQDGKAHNFDKHVADATDFGVYDYGSIMHYSSTAFSKNGQPTITVKIPPGTAGTVIGQRDGLSSKDKTALNTIYAYNACKNCGPEDCLNFNPTNTSVKQSGALWLVVDGNHSMFSAPNKPEAERIVATIKNYGLNKTCFVGRPAPDFQYLLKNTGSPVGAFAGEDCLPFNPAALEVKAFGARFKIVEGNNWLFDFPNESEARTSLCMIRKYGFTRTCYVGRPDPSLQYMRK
jgi:Astacin (Peptidase family M12A)